MSDAWRYAVWPDPIQGQGHKCLRAIHEESIVSPARDSFLFVIGFIALSSLQWVNAIGWVSAFKKHLSPAGSVWYEWRKTCSEIIFCCAISSLLDLSI